MQKDQKPKTYKTISTFIFIIQFPLALSVAFGYRSHNAGVMDFSGPVFAIMILVGASISGLLFSLLSGVAKEESTKTFKFIITSQAMIIVFIVIAWFWYVHRHNMENKKMEYWTSNSNELKKLIISDPNIAFREHWYLSSDTFKQQAFRNSLDDPTVNYTLEMLQSIYDEAPAMRDAIFRQRNCSREFISAHYTEAYALCNEKLNCDMLGGMMKNPNTPIELIEKIAESKKLPVAAVYPARSALEKRKQKQSPEHKRR